jgi:glycosyltransferase involved in cell wall biosynthesis
LADAKLIGMPHRVSRNRVSVVIPVYNHAQMVAEVVQRSLLLGVPVIVVDDGSTDATYDRIKRIEGIRILRHRSNRGKGAALLTGFAAASEFSDWAVTLDADGQHNPDDARRLIDAMPETERPIILGNRDGMLAPDVPWTSRFGREFSNFWVRMSGGPAVADSQSGFRAYPLPECLRLGVRARRFQFEVEILVKASWSRLPLVEVPVRVSYTPGTRRISHFHPFYDFLRNTGLFSRLITHRILTLRFRGANQG